MKRITNIFMAFLMGLMVVVLGSGVSILQCLHTGSVAIVGLDEVAMEVQCLSDDGQTGKASMPEGEDAMPNCMAVHTLKLSPSTFASHVSFDFHPIPTLLCPFFRVAAAMPQPTVQHILQDRKPYAWHSPPRSYLSFIRVLQL